MTLVQKVSGGLGPALSMPSVVALDALDLPVGQTARFRFTEANLSAGVKDDVSGDFFPMWGMTAGIDTESQAMLSGGGLKVTGCRAVHGPDLDVTRPFTIGVIMTVATPASKLLSGQAVLEVRDVTQWSGFSHFVQQGAAPMDEVREGADFGWYTDCTDEGEFSAKRWAPQRPMAAVFGKPCAFLVRHEGGGRVQVLACDGQQISSYGLQWDPARLLGEDGDAENRVLIGGWSVNPIQRNGELIFDLACVWDRPLSNDAVMQFARVGLAMAADRGRE